ncbi:MAG TPA: DUF192 domain-containing protein [Candidatus Binatia bacterium]|jgi:hypothetical protein
MKLSIYKLFLAVVLMACTLGSACTTDAGGARVVLHTKSGDVPVAVEIADTAERRSLGLMYRKELAAEAGMIFVFDEAEHLTFWMKNTVLPLDMIFIRDDRHVLGIVKNAVPFTTSSRGVPGESRYVLEVNAGFSDRHGVADGDEVSFEGVPGVH